MNKLIRITLLASLFLVPLASCKLGKINWPQAVKCGPGISDLVGIVSEVLLGNGNVKKELENLARTHGTDTIVCLVERLRSDWSAPGSAASPARVHGVSRANEFLADIGTKVE